MDKERFELLKGQFDSVLEALAPLEKEVLKLRFGLDGGQPSTVRETALAIGATSGIVRQVEAEALRKLRHPKPDTGTEKEA